MSDLLIVLGHVPQMIATSVMRLAHRHGIMCEIHIAVIAEELGHLEAVRYV